MSCMEQEESLFYFSLSQSNFKKELLVVASHSDHILVKEKNNNAEVCYGTKIDSFFFLLHVTWKMNVISFFGV